MFFIVVYPIQGSVATQGRMLNGKVGNKKWRPYGYGG